MLKRESADTRTACHPWLHTSAALFLAVCISALVAGCTSQPSDGGSTAGSADSAAVEQESNPTAESVAADLYRDAIADPASHFENKGVEDELVQSGEYTYALAEVENLDVPVLLLCLHGDMERWGGIDAVSVHYVNSNGALADYSDTLMRGVATSASYRGEIYASVHGNGLILNETVSGSGETRISRLEFDGRGWASRQILHSELANGEACTAPIESEQRELTWSAVSDSGVLDSLETGEWAGNVDPSAPGAVSAAEQAGLQVYAGTVRVLDTDEVCTLQGVSNPSPGYTEAEAYVLLVFDEPTNVDAVSGDGTGRKSGQAAMIRLAMDDEAWNVYDKQPVTVAVDPDNIWWPSDASLPAGEPRAQAFLLLGK